jgi:hypothetical protein
MGLDGEIQIGNPIVRTQLRKASDFLARIDCCAIRPAGRVQTKDLAPVAHVMMELMQKYVKNDGAVGIDNLDRWRNRSVAVEFLSATTSAGSFEELKKVCHHLFFI